MKSGKSSKGEDPKVGKRSQAGKSGKSAKAAKAAKATKVAKSEDAVNLAQPVEVLPAIQDATVPETTKVTKASKVAREAKLVEAATADEVIKVTDTTETIKPAESIQPAVNAEAGKPSEPSKPRRRKANPDDATPNVRKPRRKKVSEPPALVADSAVAVEATTADTGVVPDVSPVVAATARFLFKDIGGFYINGKTTASALPDVAEPQKRGVIIVDQMCVEYMIPDVAQLKAPIVMVHGSGHSGMTYLTTPDGREGWATYFARQGHPVYVVDHVGRARSGWDATRLNQAREQGKAELLPEAGFMRFTCERAWEFRFGPGPDEWYPDTRFPKEALDQYLAQLVPNTEVMLGNPMETVAALITLLRRIGSSILIVHSQSGAYGALTAIAAPDLVRAWVNVEGLARYALNEAQITGLVPVPMLVVAGDNVWRGDHLIRPVVDKVNQQGGNAYYFAPHEHGMRGYSHMLMMEHGNLELAAWIGEWLGKNMKAAVVNANPAAAPSIARSSLAAPLALRDVGAFFVNGKSVVTEFPNAGASISPGRIIIDQMYVEYMIPNVDTGKAPIVMVHGSNHTGMIWKTTPDGREGWATYFVRRGHPVYLVDHVGRGRSSWDVTGVNQAAVESRADCIPAAGFPRLSYARAWMVARLGPSAGMWWWDCRFPRTGLDLYMAQRMPNTDTTLSNPRETVAALHSLLQKIGPSIVFVHSQSGSYGVQLAATTPELVRALVNVEGHCRFPAGPASAEQMASAFGGVAYLGLSGGHVSGSGLESAARDSRLLVAAMNGMGKKADFCHADAHGMPGHTHMMMLDHGNLQIADWIDNWLQQNAA